MYLHIAYVKIYNIKSYFSLQINTKSPSLGKSSREEEDNLGEMISEHCVL